MAAEIAKDFLHMENIEINLKVHDKGASALQKACETREEIVKLFMDHESNFFILLYSQKPQI